MKYIANEALQKCFRDVESHAVYLRGFGSDRYRKVLILSVTRPTLPSPFATTQAKRSTIGRREALRAAVVEIDDASLYRRKHPFDHPFFRVTCANGAT